jgi:hypothetical protein
MLRLLRSRTASEADKKKSRESRNSLDPHLPDYLIPLLFAAYRGAIAN